MRLSCESFRSTGRFGVVSVSPEIFSIAALGEPSPALVALVRVEFFDFTKAMKARNCCPSLSHITAWNSSGPTNPASLKLLKTPQGTEENSYWQWLPLLG
jgi:hypothetical protein